MVQSHVTVRLYGILSAYGGPRELSFDAQTMQDVLIRLSELGVDKSLLKCALVFINDYPVVGSLRLKHKLECGDVIAFLSPSGGG